MFTLNVLLLLQEAPGAGGLLGSFLVPMLLIFVVFYFLIIRPQRKKEQEKKAMVEAVKKNDRVVTIGGLHGKVTQVDEASVLVEVDTNTKVRVEKNALAVVEPKDKPAASK